MDAQKQTLEDLRMLTDRILTLTLEVKIGLDLLARILAAE